MACYSKKHLKCKSFHAHWMLTLVRYLQERLMLYLSPDIQTTAPWHAPNLSGYPVRLKWYTYENTHTNNCYNRWMSQCGKV